MLLRGEVPVTPPRMMKKRKRMDVAVRIRPTRPKIPSARLVSQIDRSRQRASGFRDILLAISKSGIRVMGRGDCRARNGGISGFKTWSFIEESRERVVYYVGRHEEP